jgi:hypothetical protein
MKRALVVLLLGCGCIQSTGGSLVGFHAQASGDPAVVTGGPLAFTTPSGFDVTHDVAVGILAWMHALTLCRLRRACK